MPIWICSGRDASRNSPIRTGLCREAGILQIRDLATVLDINVLMQQKVCRGVLGAA